MSFPRAVIDAQALRHNLAVVRQFAPRSKVMAVVKANAYGHGLIPSAHALRGADALGVARLDEGVALRRAGIAGRIVLLEGVFAVGELQAAAQDDFELVVHSAQQVAMLEHYGGPHRFNIWLKVDTGMNRLGLRCEEQAAACQRLQASSAVGELRLMTHLARAEEAGCPANTEQLDRFAALHSGVALERSIANSAGLILWPRARSDWVRPGLMLYGISPIPGMSAAALGLRPVMTLTTQLIALRHVPRGEAVGYGGTWQATRDSLIGIAGVGYGDGYPRNMRTGTPVLVNGAEVQVVGRVSMDMTAVDLTDQPGARVGDTVIVWGTGLPAERVAPYADTIAYELVCGISQRVAVEWRE